VLLNTMYELPSREDIGECVITAEVVQERVNPTLVRAFRHREAQALGVADADWRDARRGLRARASTLPGMTDVTRPELPSGYDPAEVETRRYEWWESSGWFHADADDDGEPFCIVIPLPNVTGSLHIGHALDHSIQDALIRWQRMRGANAMWQPGTDHAGIATQNVVEKQLAAEGLSRHDIGREAFLERVWRWKEESGGTILRQMRRLGASPDWEREAFTLDEPRSKAVREVFCALYDDGLIYRGYRLINWCPRCATALSDIEVDHADEMGELAYLRYPAADGGEGVVVATTRTETMLGDTGVAVHPDDERYAHLVGKTVLLPLLDREIPVVADDHVDPEFGTGAVKVTPAHDPNDYDIGQRHGLETIDIMTDEARISPAGGPYEGLDRFEARSKIKEDLDALGLLVKVEEREHAVGHCSRCHTVIEPRLSDQWFVKVGPLARPRSRRCATDGRGSTRSATPVRSSTGWRTSTTGPSPGRSGGVIRSPRGTTATATSTSCGPTHLLTRSSASGSSATPTSSTRGSPPRCGPSPPRGGRSRVTTPRSCGPGTRGPCSSPGTTSTPSG
jgi:valyl-tRNA synthetase